MCRRRGASDKVVSLKVLLLVVGSTRPLRFPIRRRPLLIDVDEESYSLPLLDLLTALGGDECSFH